jgi:hypothetical protein
VRSGREVRAFLRGLGICLDSPAAVIKQAHVTALADSNDPADLAALVAEASGLGATPGRALLGAGRRTVAVQLLMKLCAAVERSTASCQKHRHCLAFLVTILPATLPCRLLE